MAVAGRRVMLVGSENKQRTDCPICTVTAIPKGGQCFAVRKGKGFFGGINRTCPIHPAAGSELQTYSQSDGRAKQRIGAILDTSDQGC